MSPHAVAVRTAVTVRRAADGDGVSEWLGRSWGEAVIAVHGELYDAATLPALVAIKDDQVVGLLTYVTRANELEIVTCDANPRGRGVGRALVDAAVDLAGAYARSRVWCTTTNDNLPALGFWQAVGFRLVDLRPDAVGAARALKPSIPLLGYRDLPVRDELDLELRL